MSEDIKQLGIFLHIFHSSIVTNGHTNHKKTNCVAKNIILGFSIIKKIKCPKVMIILLNWWILPFVKLHTDGLATNRLLSPVLMVVNNPSQVLFLSVAPSLFPINLK